MKKLLLTAMVALLGISGEAFAAGASLDKMLVHKPYDKCRKAQAGQVARTSDGVLLSCARGEFRPAVEQVSMLVTITHDAAGREDHAYVVSGYTSRVQCEADLSRATLAIIEAHKSEAIVSGRCEFVTSQK